MTMVTRSVIAFTLLLLGLLMAVQAYPGGAPASTCLEMTPQHDIPAQKLESLPFSTTPDVMYVAHNGTLRLTIASNNGFTSFKGYLVVTNPIGKGIFKAPSDGQLLACKMADDSTLDASGVTHRGEESKKSVTVNWVPNGYTGNITFMTTYVLDFTTYWVKTESVTVRVLKDGELPPDQTEPSTEPPTEPPSPSGAVGLKSNEAALMMSSVVLAAVAFIAGR